MFTLANTKALARAVLKPQQKRPLEIRGRTEELFLHGFVEAALKPSDSLSTTLQTLKDLSDGKIREPFFFQEKLPHYFLLRPTAYEYTNAFEDLLFENEIPQLLEELTGSPLRLGHLSVLKHMPGIRANTEWHRDTHFLSGELAGPMPPSVKVYFYPSLQQAPSPRVNFIKGSNRVDLQRPVLEQLFITGSVPTVVSSSDNRLVVFDTTTLHQAVPDTDPRGSMRLLYIFYRLEDQVRTRHPTNIALYERYGARAGIR